MLRDCDCERFWGLWGVLGVLWAQEGAEGSCGCCVGCLKLLVGAWGLRCFLGGSVSDVGSGRCWGVVSRCSWAQMSAGKSFRSPEI